MKKTTRQFKSKMQVREVDSCIMRMSDDDIIQRGYDKDKGEGEEEEVYRVTISSDKRADMGWGNERLSHKAGHVRLNALNSGKHMFLFNHHRDIYLARILGGVANDKGELEIGVRYVKNKDRAETIKDVKNGSLRGTSLAYRTYKTILVKRGKNGELDEFDTVDWEPMEGSAVTIPVDSTVGTRGEEYEKENIITILEDEEMLRKHGIRYLNQTQVDGGIPPAPVAIAPAPATPAVVEKITVREPSDDEINKRADERMKSREDRRAGFDLVRSQWPGIKDSEFKDALDNPKLSARDFAFAQMEKRAANPTKVVEFTENEEQKYSLTRAILMTDPRYRGDKQGFELDVSQEIAKRSGQTPAGIFIPPELFTRDMTATGSGTGDDLVATELHAERFVEPLYNRPICKRAGAIELTGLKGNISVPEISAADFHDWKAEATAVGEITPTSTTIDSSPNKIGSYTDFSKQLVIQGSVQIQRVIWNLMLKALAAKIDLACLHGAGGDAPTGLASVSGIGSVAGGTDGLAPAWIHLMKLEREIAVDNASMGKLAYLTNAYVIYKLRTTQNIATYGTRHLLEASDRKAEGDFILAGRPLFESNNISHALTKGSGTGVGVCSAIFYGNFADMWMMYWGGIDVLIDPYTGGKEGLIRIIADAFFDMAVKRAISFAAMLDALTTD